MFGLSRPLAPNQMRWMREHQDQVDADGDAYQTTHVGGSVVEWGPHTGTFIGDRKPRHMVINSNGWPAPVWDK